MSDCKLKQGYTAAKIAKKYGIGVEKARKVLADASIVELEHTSDYKIAMTIASQHLHNESLNYYKELAKVEAKFGDGGEVKPLTITEYIARAGIEILYVGTDYKKAKSEFDSADRNNLDREEQYFGGVVQLSKLEKQYKYVGDVDEIEDYPFEDYFEDSDYYELTNEYDDPIIINERFIEGTEQEKKNLKERGNEILSDVVSHYKKLYPYNIAGWYLRQSIYLLVPTEDVDKNIELRISNHSLNPQNIDNNKNFKTKQELVKRRETPKEIDTSNPDLYDAEYDSDGVFVTYYQVIPKNRVALLSVVIFGGENETSGRFDRLSGDSEEIEFDVAEYDTDEIIKAIDNELSDIMVNTIGVAEVFNNGGKIKDCKKGCAAKGKSHKEGGIKAIVVDQDKMVEIESGEVVISKHSVADDTLHTFDGKKMKAAQILSELNQVGGGVPIPSPTSNIFEKGGMVKEKKYRRDGKLITESELMAKIASDRDEFRSQDRQDNWAERDNEIKQQNIEQVKYPEQKYEIGDKVLFVSINHGWVQGHIEEAKYLEKNELNDTLGWHYYIPEFGSVMLSENSIKPYLETLQDTQFAYFKGTDYQYENLFTFNKAIEYLINLKVKHTIELEGRLREVVIESNELTADETAFVSRYVGYGGLEKQGATMQDGSPTALLYEYYTPDEIVKMMWALAYKHGNKPESLLEPSVSTGRFFKYANGAKCVGFEINIYSAVICKILHPESTIYHNYFEEAFIKNNASIKDKTYGLLKYNLIIGNPPYGGISGGASKWFAMGEDGYSKASNYIDYFIFRGLDLLVLGGLLIYIVGAEKHAGGNLFLEKGDNKTKQLIAEKAELVDAYKLPAKLFETTGVSSEIIVLRKI